MKGRKLNIKNLIILLCGLLACIIFIYFIASGISKVFTQSKEPKVINTPNIESRTVVIDPGHGGYDDGAIAYNGYKESVIVLDIAKKVKAILTYYNLNVVMSRESEEVTWSDDNVEDLRARSDLANSSNATLFVSIHCNSAEEIDEAKGSEIYVYFDQEESYRLANHINDELKKITELENREMKDANRFPLQLLIENRVPSCIVEMGFLTDYGDAEFMMSEEGQNKLANAIATGILKDLNIEIKVNK